MGGRTVGAGEVAGARDPLRYWETLEIAGSVQTASPLDGEAWYRDPNGQSRPVSGDELATYALAHALVFHTWLDTDPPGFSRAVDDSGVTFTPRGEGATRRLVLERLAGRLLPVRLEQRQQGTAVTTTFEDWREVDGILFPFSSTQKTGDPRFDVRMIVSAVELLDELPADAVVAPDGPGPDDARVTDRALAGAIPLELVGGLPVVRVEIEGRTGLSFLLDTGAGATVIAASLSDSLGLRTRGIVEARGGGGSEAATFVDVPSLTLPGVEVDTQIIVALPLETLSAALGRPVHGILGWDFLSRFVVEIDYPGLRVAVSPAGDYEPPPGATRIPLRLEANVPRIGGVIDGRAGSLLLDTGNASTLFLHAAFAREADLIEEAEETELRISGIAGEEPTLGVVVDRLEIGPLAWEGVSAVVPIGDEGILAIDEAIGNVGSALFLDAVIALDYGEGALWIRRTTDSASSR